MMTLAACLDSALRAAGVPIVGVAIGAESDRSSWKVAFDPDATKQQRDLAGQIMASLDVSEPVLTAAANDAAMMTLPQQVWVMFTLRRELKRQPTAAEIAAVKKELLDLYVAMKAAADKA